MLPIISAGQDHFTPVLVTRCANVDMQVTPVSQPTHPLINLPTIVCSKLYIVCVDHYNVRALVLLH